MSTWPPPDHGPTNIFFLKAIDAASTHILLGMEFIKTFQKTLFLHNNLVALLDQGDVNEMIKEAIEQIKAAVDQSSNADTNST